jgi:hypothetical protein
MRNMGAGTATGVRYRGDGKPPFGVERRVYELQPRDDDQRPFHPLHHPYQNAILRQ